MGPVVLIVPLALGAIALAAAASKKKPAATPGATPGATSPTNANAQVSAQVSVPVPLDVQTMITQAVNSGNLDTMRNVAKALKVTYPAQSKFLDDTANELAGALAPYGANVSSIEQAQQVATTQAALQAAQTSAGQALAAGASPAQAVQAAQQAATSVAQAAAPAPLTTPAASQITAALAVPQQSLQAAQAAGSAALAAGASPVQAILAAQNAAVMTATPGVNQAVTAAVQAAQQLPGVATAPAVRPEPAAAPMPAVAPADTTTAAGKQLAADMTKALLKAKKGTSSEPRALVKAFQEQERLSQDDGSYGFETAMALADRYGIVPPKPLYWGKKNGPATLPAQQKAAYSAHLMVLKANDPQRADEWAAAAKV